MNAVATRPHVTLSGDIVGEYVIQRPDGRLTVVPDRSWAAALTRNGERKATEQEWRDFLAEHGPHMGAPDGEG